MLNELKQWARHLKAEIYALYLACRDPRVPWYARVFVACVVGYALSPIDLIPDFVPVLGYLDDLIVLPLGLSIALRLIPPELMEDCRAQARERMAGSKPRSWLAAAVIVVIWLALAAGVGLWVRRAWGR